MTVNPMSNQSSFGNVQTSEIKIEFDYSDELLKRIGLLINGFSSIGQFVRRISVIFIPLAVASVISASDFQKMPAPYRIAAILILLLAITAGTFPYYLAAKKFGKNFIDTYGRHLLLHVDNEGIQTIRSSATCKVNWNTFDRLRRDEKVWALNCPVMDVLFIPREYMSPSIEEFILGKLQGTKCEIKKF